MTGTFEANIVNYGVSETKDGRPQVTVTFECFHLDEAGLEKVEKITWYGSLYEGAIPITLETLLHCGLKRENFGKLDKLMFGPQSFLLDLERGRNISIQEKPHYRDASRTQRFIAWIRDPKLSSGQTIAEEKNNLFFSENSGYFVDTLNQLAEALNLEEKTEVTKEAATPDPEIPF